MNVAVLNDTSGVYHWGCYGTSAALKSGLSRAGVEVVGVPQGWLASDVVPETGEAFVSDAFWSAFCVRNPRLVRALRDADEVVVHGEGTLHGLGRRAVGLLYAVWACATRLGKAVHVVNASCFPCDDEGLGDERAAGLYRSVLGVCSTLVMRDAVSVRLMGELGLEAVRGFDCLPVAIDGLARPVASDTDEPIVLAGCVTWGAAYARALDGVIAHANEHGRRVEFLVGGPGEVAQDDRRLIAALLARGGRGWTARSAATFEAWCGAIAGAGVLVSGRFHHSIAAACLGTPAIALASNTPKMGVLDEIGVVRLGGAPDGVEVVGAIERAEAESSADVRPKLVGLARRNVEAVRLGQGPRCGEACGASELGRLGRLIESGPVATTAETALVRRTAAQLRESGMETIALYGAGKHTQRVGPGVWASAGVRVSVVVDDEPYYAELEGVPVRQASEVEPGSFDAVVVSSDAHEATLAARARGHFGEGMPIIRLYALDEVAAGAGSDR